MKMLETIHILPVRAESAAPAPLRGKKLDQRAVLQVVRKVDWKKAGLIAKLDALQAENRMLRAELEKKNAPSEEQN